MKSKKFAAAGIAGAASLALAFGAAGTASAAGSLDGLLGGGSLGSSTAPGTNCGTTVVTPDSHGIWSTPGDENKPGFAEIKGEGALALTQAPEKGTSFYRTVGMPVSALLDDSDNVTEIEYRYYAEGDASVTNTPALQLRVTGAPTGEGDGFATIVWSPEPSTGEWKEAKPENSDQFWVTRTLQDGQGDPALVSGKRTTLSDIIKKMPDATLDQIGVQQTKENTATNVGVDTFTFGCETTDFELDDPEAGGSLAGIFGSLESLGGK